MHSQPNSNYLTISALYNAPSGASVPLQATPQAPFAAYRLPYGYTWDPARNLFQAPNGELAYAYYEYHRLMYRTDKSLPKELEYSHTVRN